MALMIDRRIGGPGTGKTHLLLGQLSEWKANLSLAPEEIGLCTFTRNGRRELSERAAAEWGVEPDVLTKAGFFRTAHSIAYRQIEVEDGQLLHGKEGSEWLAGLFPGQVNATLGQETSYGSSSPAAMALRAWDLARNKIVPLGAILRLWRALGGQSPGLDEATWAVTRYETAKMREGRLDYTDLVARFAGVRFTKDGPSECSPQGDVPDTLRVLAIDEAQDSSALVDRVCRRLAASDRVEAVFLCGDPYQSIYSFTGSDYRHFLAWDAVESVMPRSYRCPPEVMAIGEKCIREMRFGYRDRGILPASHAGRIIRATCPHDAMEHAKEGSVLIVGRCGHSLSPYHDYLTERGIPHQAVDRVGSVARVSGYAAYWALQHGEPITGDDWQKAISMTQANHKELGGLIRRGEKAAWEKGRRASIDVILPTDDDMAMAGCTESLIAAIRSGEWVRAIDADHAKSAAEWFASARKHGPKEASDPRVKLSTIHSAKGAEADTVIVSTVTSPAVERARLLLDESHDEECRVAYVAVTRARHKLVVVDDGGEYRMRIPA